MIKKRNKHYHWHHIQLYKFQEYLDILPYTNIALSCGFFGFGWLHWILSFHILPKIMGKSNYIKLIDRKLYLIYSLSDFSTPRIMIHKDTISFIIANLTFEYER